MSQRHTFALHLYRALLKAGQRMPTSDRAKLVKWRTRHEFQQHKGLTDTDKIEFLTRLGQAQLDNVLLQAKHLSQLQRRGLLKP